MNLKDKDKNKLKESIKQLIINGVTSNYGIKQQLKKQGINTTRKTIKNYRDEITSELIKPEPIYKPITKIHPKTIKKIIQPTVKKYKKLGNKYVWYTPECPGCKRTFPINSSSPNEGVICAQCGYEFQREINKEKGLWVKLTPINKTNYKYHFS